MFKEDLKAFSKNSRSPMYIQLAGVTFPDPSYHIERKDSLVTVIEYVLDGYGYIYIDGEPVKIGKDTVYLLTQGEDHAYYADKDDPYSKIFLNVYGRFCNELLEAYNLIGKKVFSAAKLKPIFEKIPKIIYAELTENDMQSALQGVFLEIVSALSFAEIESVHSKEALTLKSYLDSNASKIVNISELANLIFRSADYCQKLFAKEFGKTPYVYQLDKKMQIAKSLLTNTNMSVGEIAESLGYSDAHYFSNLFFRKCGVRPLHYRKSKKQSV